MMCYVRWGEWIRGRSWALSVLPVSVFVIAYARRAQCDSAPTDAWSSAGLLTSIIEDVEECR